MTPRRHCRRNRHPFPQCILDYLYQSVQKWRQDNRLVCRRHWHWPHSNGLNTRDAMIGSCIFLPAFRLSYQHLLHGLYVTKLDTNLNPKCYLKREEVVSEHMNITTIRSDWRFWSKLNLINKSIVKDVWRRWGYFSIFEHNHHSKWFANQGASTNETALLPHVPSSCQDYTPFY